MSQSWALPDGFEEILPPRAEALERLRRRLLDHYAGFGYRLVNTPLMEYFHIHRRLAGDDVSADTFVLTDPETGELLALRADMTPQVARIDAQFLTAAPVNRLCYTGSVLRTRSPGPRQGRSPMQIGLELYGADAIEADDEVLGLMLDSVCLSLGVGLESETLSDSVRGRCVLALGHAGCVTALLAQPGSQTLRAEAVQTALFEALRLKSRAAVSELLQQQEVPPPCREDWLALLDLSGDVDVLDEAEQRFGRLPELRRPLQRLRAVLATARAHPLAPQLHLDLAEQAGFGYESGLNFVLIDGREGHELARGGRYDGVGALFGRSRPAVGFSADLRALARVMPWSDSRRACVWLPLHVQRLEGAAEPVAALRAEGRVVVRELPGQTEGPLANGCREVLDWIDGRWQVVGIA